MVVSKSDITGILQISGTLEIESASAFREVLVDCFVSQSEVTIDLAGIESFDVACAQVLLAAQREGQRVAKRFHVTAASACVTDAFTTLGFPHAT